jgi:hypothetical protein
VSNNLPRLLVRVQLVWHESVESGEADALIVPDVFLHRGKLRVVSASGASSTDTLVEDVVFGVDVVFGSAAVGEVAV